MSLWLALGLLGGQDAVGEDIVVTGRARPLQINVQLDSKRRVHACAIAQSSGDESFDRLTCETVAACSREPDRSKKAIQACTQTQMTKIINDQFGADADRQDTNAQN
ncbi:hypothetical protein Q9Q95_02755 [Sphingomonas sp. DG1-23]|uniref:hypothetical protein n=1 Tax=Sphingomonas sp. DG1-23 TaxID=3068316 RepID=UPI00273EEC61|nr:hypothetical protein [Sphingomonas sp. DG1-23]MDP5277833.1 hypothetical protein [Sphingomonas sp. DG1-23]